MTEEFYSIPLFVRMFVQDVAATAKWYADALGFHSAYTQHDSEGRQLMNHIRLAKYQDLMLAQTQNVINTPPNGCVINFFYIGDLKALAQRAVAAGATVGGPTAMPYNAYELTVIDPNGFILIFSQMIDAVRTFEDVMSAIDSP